MITTKGLTKKFDDFIALSDFNAEIPDGCIYGLVGSNGSGKSTLMRLISGIYRPDDGTVKIDGLSPYENNMVKNRVFHVSDELYFFPGARLNDMAAFYEQLYSGFDRATYTDMCRRFPIDPKKKIATFSKGMKRQVSLILGLSCRPKYLLLDEAFDGLDPIIRIGFRKLLADQMSEHEMSVVIASHNLRELEDLCDHMGLLHKGKVIFQREIDQGKLGFCKIQIGFREIPEDDAFAGLDVLRRDRTGSVINLIVRGDSDATLKHLQNLNPLFVETIPLTLEEVFIHEMEAVGYDYNKIIF